MISAIAWVPRGVAKEVPEPTEYTEEELALAKRAAEEGATESSNQDDDDADFGDEDMSEEDSEAEDPEAEIAKAKAFAKTMKSESGGAGLKDLDSAMAELKMDRYDEDMEEDEGGVRGIFGNTNPGMAYYGDNMEDPYIKLSAANDADSDADDDKIKGEDFVLLTAKNEEDLSLLEVWVYEAAEEVGGESNLFVHHDIMLPAFPLSLAWMSAGPSAGREQPGNFAAIGTMNPGIEIWNLDVLDQVEPAATLGGEAKGKAAGDASEAAKKKTKKKSKKKASENLVAGSHTDAVLSLSWNREHQNVLASGSADNSIKIWDVTNQQCQVTLDWHSDKVQAVAWNPADAPVLLSAAFDKTARLGDTRTPSSALQWKITADAEALAWNPFEPTQFLVSSEDGLVAAFDARAGANSKPLYTLSAHDKPTCSLSFNPACKGLLTTASTDKQVKLWDVSDKPSLVASQDMNVGALFAGCFCPESPSLYACGGAKGELLVWDILTNSAVATKYGKQIARQMAV